MPLIEKLKPVDQGFPGYGRTPVCVVCGGRVANRCEICHTGHSCFKNKYWCMKCGLMYDFLPPDIDSSLAAVEGE